MEDEWWIDPFLEKKKKKEWRGLKGHLIKFPELKVYGSLGEE